MGRGDRGRQVGLPKGLAIRAIEGAVLVCLVLAVGACVLVAPDDPAGEPGPTLDFDRIALPNLRPDPEEDEMPLATGLFWRYRDVTAGHLPTHVPAPDWVVEVLATVASDDGTACHAVREGEAGGGGVVRFLHRSETGLVLYGEDVSGAVRLLTPPVLILPLPLAPDNAWSWEWGGRAFDGRVLFPETLVLSAGAFRAWKVEVRERGSPDAEFTWYAPGIGVLKIVRGSRSYELVEASLLGSARSHSAGPEASAETPTLNIGDTLVVELPAQGGTPYAWWVGPALDRSALLPLGVGHFVPDPLPPDAEGGSPGTFVLSFRAVGRTAPDSAPIEFLYSLPGEEPPVYRVTMRVVVR